jgi:apolipoprotein D and lipocalin family protein
MKRTPTSFGHLRAQTLSSAMEPMSQPISVLNSCRYEKDDKLRQAKGRAWVVDHTSNARLKVSFFWPFRGDYWIIKLGKEYEYSVVATPNRKYLWVLSRIPTMSDDLYADILKDAERQGFDTKNVIKEVQPPQNRHISAGTSSSVSTAVH